MLRRQADPAHPHAIQEHGSPDTGRRREVCGDPERGGQAEDEVADRQAKGGAITRNAACGLALCPHPIAAVIITQLTSNGLARN